MGNKEIVAVVMGRVNQNGAHQFIVIPNLTVRSGTKLGDLLKALIRKDEKKVSDQGQVMSVILTRTDSNFLEHSSEKGLDAFDKLNLKEVIPTFAGLGSGRSATSANVPLSEEVKTGDVFVLMPGNLGPLDLTYIAFRQQIDSTINSFRSILGP